MSRDISTEELKKAYLISAKIVSLYGEKYLPIFERLESEYRKRKKSKEALQRALSVIEKISD
ncbi:MAG: hypothetical protein ACRBDL_08810 [Alphaproteobacteria bacterium]